MTDLRNLPSDPFGPLQPGLRGGLLRMAQWALTILTVILAWPAVMTVFTAVTILLPRDGMFRVSAEEWLTIARWLTGAATLLLTGLRVSGKWWCWWAFAPVAIAAAALALTGDPGDPEGVLVQQMEFGLPVLLAALHALWSLCNRRGDQHEV